jgi:hypothetical protein
MKGEQKYSRDLALGNDIKKGQEQGSRKLTTVKCANAANLFMPVFLVEKQRDAICLHDSTPCTMRRLKHRLKKGFFNSEILGSCKTNVRHIRSSEHAKVFDQNH